MTAYYNEFDPYAAQWLRNLIEQDLIAPGDVDERSIVDVQPDDLKGYTQCHFFAGIGGWSYAARLAGWPDDRELWTGSCPCQPYSIVGRRLAEKDERDLWPVWFRLVDGIRPSTLMGEQVKDAIGKHWLDRMRVDLEASGYSLGATVLPACAVDAPHRRDRLWFVADAGGERWERRQGHTQGNERDRQTAGWQESHGGLVGSDKDACPGNVADPNQPCEGQRREQRSGQLGRSRSNSRGSAWVGAEWLAGADEKARRFEPSIRLLAHGVPARVGKLRAYGNAIVPQVAAEVIAAYMEAVA